MQDLFIGCLVGVSLTITFIILLVLPWLYKEKEVTVYKRTPEQLGVEIQIKPSGKRKIVEGIPPCAPTDST